MMLLSVSTTLRMRGLCLVGVGFKSKLVGLLMPYGAWPVWNTAYYLLSVLLCDRCAQGLNGTGISLAMVGSTSCLIKGWEPYVWRHIFGHDTVSRFCLLYLRRVRRSCGTTPVAGVCRLQSLSADAGMHPESMSWVGRLLTWRSLLYMVA